MIRELEKSYSVEEDGFEGNYFGYIVDVIEENLKNFIKSEINNESHAEKLYSVIKENVNTIFVLKNLNINDNFQGRGHGKMVLEDVLEEAYNGGADACILLADSEAGQRNDFVLTNFYEDNDFEKVYGEDKYPLMMAPSDISFKIKDEVDDFLIEEFMKKRSLNKKRL